MSVSSDLAVSAGVRAARAILGWSQKELSSRSGVSVPSINRFERGEGGTRGSTIASLTGCLEGHGVDVIVTPDNELRVLVATKAVAQVVQRALNDEAVTSRGKFGPRQKNRIVEKGGSRG